MIYVLVAVAAVAALYWFILRKRAPKGWSVGPLVRGKNYSRGVDFTVRGETWTASIGTGDELDGITKARGPVAGTIRAAYTVSGTFAASEAPAEECGLTVFFQRAGDDWSGRGDKAHYRWYSNTLFPLTPGVHRIEVPLTPEHWHNVTGGQARDAVAQFNAALTDKGRIGFGFGWRGGRQHGVTGAGAVTLESWSIG